MSSISGKPVFYCAWQRMNTRMRIIFLHLPVVLLISRDLVNSVFYDVQGKLSFLSQRNDSFQIRVDAMGMQRGFTCIWCASSSFFSLEICDCEVRGKVHYFLSVFMLVSLSLIGFSAVRIDYCVKKKGENDTNSGIRSFALGKRQRIY